MEQRSASQMFIDAADLYEAMIDWPKRLSHEAPFYRKWFDLYKVRSVVDVACGVGHHAAMFHDWGLRVEGADISRAMIDRARSRFGEPAGLHWVVRGFDEPLRSDEPFDAAVCVGNSLPLAPNVAAAEQAMAQMLASIRRGGLLIVHLLNLWRLPEGPCVWQKRLRAALPQGDVLIIKGVRRCGRQGFVELLATGLEKESPLQSESAVLLGLEADDLDAMARKAGAENIRFYGGYCDEPYVRDASVDLLLVADRAT